MPSASPLASKRRSRWYRKGRSRWIPGKQISRPDREPTGRYSSVELIHIGGTRVRRFLHHPQDCRGRPGTSFGDDSGERTQLFQGQLLDGLALCRRDAFEAPNQVVRHYNGEVRHPVNTPGPIVTHTGRRSQGDFPVPGTNRPAVVARFPYGRLGPINESAIARPSASLGAVIEASPGGSTVAVSARLRGEPLINLSLTIVGT